MLTSQFSVKPENPRLFLKQKGITFEVCFFFPFLSLRWSTVQQRNGGKQRLAGVLYAKLSFHQIRSSNQSITQFQAKTFSLDVRASLWPWNWQRNTHICAAYPKLAQVLWRIWCSYYHWWSFQFCSSSRTTIYEFDDTSESLVLFSRFKEQLVVP